MNSWTTYSLFSIVTSLQILFKLNQIRLLTCLIILDYHSISTYYFLLGKKWNPFVLTRNGLEFVWQLFLVLVMWSESVHVSVNWFNVTLVSDVTFYGWYKLSRLLERVHPYSLSLSVSLSARMGWHFFSFFSSQISLSLFSFFVSTG